MKLQDKLALIKRNTEDKTNSHNGVAGKGEHEFPFVITCLSSMSPKYGKLQTEYNRKRIEAGDDAEKIGRAFAEFMAAVTVSFELDGDKLEQSDITDLYEGDARWITLALDTARKDEPFIKAPSKNSLSGRGDSSNSGKKSTRKTPKA